MRHTVIVIVEPEAVLADLLREVVEEGTAAHVLTVASADAARQILGLVRVDALLLDLDPPGWGGLALYDHLVADAGGPCPPVVLLTVAPHTPELAARRPAHLLAKPFAVADVLAQVEGLLAARHRLPFAGPEAALAPLDDSPWWAGPLPPPAPAA